MDWTEKRVLVTGAGGFIGSHLTERLVDHGADVRAFVRYNSRNDPGLLRLLPGERLDRVRILMGDLRDADAVRSAVRDVDVVFHLGSLIAIPYSYARPRETVETNVLGALNVFEAARDAGVEKVVHTSTSEVYGTARYVPIDEDHPLQGQSPYSASKIGADKVAESFYRSFDVPIATIRPFNTYGPRQSARAVIPTIITQALVQGKVARRGTTPTSTTWCVRFSLSPSRREQSGRRSTSDRTTRSRSGPSPRRLHPSWRRRSRSSPRADACGRRRARSSGSGATTPGQSASLAGLRLCPWKKGFCERLHGFGNTWASISPTTT